MAAHRTRAAQVVILSAAGAAYAWIASRLVCSVGGVAYASLTDDMMISMRYARNLAEGQGLVWNAGEPAVEGFTNLLWTLWMAVGHLLPFSDRNASLWVFGSSAACLLIAAWLSGCVAETLLPQSRAAKLGAMVLCAAYFPLVRWSMLGFEVGLLSVLQTWALLVALRLEAGSRAGSEWLLGCLFGTALLTRPDTLSFVCVIGAYAMASAPRGPLRRHRAARILLPVLVVLVGVEAFRLVYYQSLLPNTVSLKMTGVSLDAKLERGWAAVLTTLTSHYIVLFVPIVVALATQGVRNLRGRLAVLIVVLGELGYTVLMGGDTWEGPQFANRPLSAAAPSLLALTSVGIAELAQHFRASLRWALPAMYAFIVYSLSGPAALEFARFDYCQSSLFTKVKLALYVREKLPQDSRIAAVWAGAFPYFARMPAVDILGKSDRVIAKLPARNASPGHNKWDYAHSLGQLKPVVLDELFGDNAADFTLVQALGYRQGNFGAWYHSSLGPIGHEPVQP